MADLNVPFVAFNGGEIGLEAEARVDLDVYPTTASVMENVLPLMQGSMIKAPGTEYIHQLMATAAIVRPFVYNVDETRTLVITDGQIEFVDGNAVVDIVGAAATVGPPVDNTSTGGSVVVIYGLDVVFGASASGEARAYWPITGGEVGEEVTFRFTIERRPLSIRVGTSAILNDIELPGGVDELVLYPGTHILTFTPTAASYFIRVRLQEEGTAILTGLTRLGVGEFRMPTPYTAGDLPGLRYEQSADTFWLYHPAHRTRVLERRDNGSWSLRLFRPLNGPYEVPNTGDIAITPSARSGLSALTASMALFTPDCVGQLVEITHTGQTESETFSGADQATDSIRVVGVEQSRIFTVTIGGTFTGDTLELQRSAGNELDWVTVSTYTSTTSAQVDDDLDNQIIYYRVVCTIYGSGSPTATLTYSGGETTGRAEIIEYTSPTAVFTEVYDAFGKVSASTNWSIGAWSGDLGWPAAGTLFDGRHHLVRDDLYWGSEADDYEAFLIGTEDGAAISKRMGTGDVNIARWIEGTTRLLVGTGGAELEVRTTAFDEAFTPTNINLRGVDDWGSADTQAVRAGKRVIFVDRTRSLLLQCLFDAETNSHEVDNLCRLHERIAGEIEAESGDGFVEIAYQKRPEPRIWCVRADGQLAVLLFGPKEGVYAWARITAAEGGLFKSVCVVPGKPEDRVHVVVEREIAGETRLYHERFALERFINSVDAWRLQSALTQDFDPPTTTITGLDHLEGETVHIWGDGRYLGSRDVESGVIELESNPDDFLLEDGSGGFALEEGQGIESDVAVSRVTIGLNYVGKWMSSKLAYGAQLGSALTMNKQVKHIGFVVKDTAAGAIKYHRTFETNADGVYLGDLLRPEFVDGQIMDTAARVWTGEFAQGFSGANLIDSRVCLIFDTPMPAQVLALVPALTLDERNP